LCQTDFLNKLTDHQLLSLIVMLLSVITISYDFHNPYACYMSYQQHDLFIIKAKVKAKVTLEKAVRPVGGIEV